MNFQANKVIANYLISSAQLSNKHLQYVNKLALIQTFDPSFFYNNLQTENSGTGKKVKFQHLLAENEEKVFNNKCLKLVEEILNGSEQDYLTYWGYLNLICKNGQNNTEYNKTFMYRTTLGKITLYSRQPNEIEKLKIQNIISDIAKLKYVQVQQQIKMMEKISSHSIQYEKTVTFRDFIRKFIKNHKEIQLFVENYGEYCISKDAKQFLNISLPNIPLEKYIQTQTPFTQRNYDPPFFKAQRKNRIFQKPLKSPESEEYLIKFMSPECLETNMGYTSRISTKSSLQSSAFYQQKPKQGFRSYRSPQPIRKIFTNRFHNAV